MTATTPESKADTAKRAAARRSAMELLRQEHDERFQIIMAEECRKLGVSYSPRLTPQQKGEQLILETAKAHGIDLAKLAKPAERPTGDDGFAISA